ncbi:universal stress protein [Bacillus sp. CGMCC 1.16607]|uniref:universal stress protein n=1 Tax=Bacillus sp. CGMCC 1.16607 TaxID=3351842 RepID=UPI003625B02B
MKKILVPVDGSEDSNKAILYALSLWEGKETEIILLNIQPSYNTPNVKRFVSQEQIRGYQQELSQEVLEKSLAVTETKSPNVSISTKVRIGIPGIEICVEAKESQVACIVMGSRGLGAIKRTVLGSVSYSVLHDAPCPVTIVP